VFFLFGYSPKIPLSPLSTKAAPFSKGIDVLFPSSSFAFL